MNALRWLTCPRLLNLGSGSVEPEFANPSHHYEHRVPGSPLPLLSLHPQRFADLQSRPQ